ncbi:M14 family metallopeptidase [Chloroflexota bacterium]
MTYSMEFTEYFEYKALTAHLEGLAAAYPNLTKLESLGQSFQGRDIWCMTLTNQATGLDTDKPAFYIDSNIHAEEVLTSMVGMYTIWYLLTNYGTDEEATWLLDNTAFYIVPRVNPDGAEVSLTTPYHWVGNGRYQPGEEQTAGLCQHDVNGDGWIVQMRLEDPDGEWKISDQDPRLMIQREAGEIGPGPYYRMYPEGEIRGDWDGVTIDIQKPRDGNLNRNYPAGWRGEFRQYGAGDYPLSEPETKAVAEFILAHPNITGAQAYHTHGGAHLRPSLVEPDSTLPRFDLALYNKIGKIGTGITGYPVISVYEEFTVDPDKPRVGSLMQWTYDEMGIITFSTECWNVELAAGVGDPAHFQIGARSAETEIALLAYNDTHLGGKGFVDWTPFEHPQLGSVEIGGWTHLHTLRNPPPAAIATTEEAKGWLQETCHKNTLFTLKHAACAPLLQIKDVTATAVAPGLYKVAATVKNTGFLPTYLTERSLVHNASGAVEVALEGAGLTFEMGLPTQDIGHLAGREERTSLWSPWLRQWGDAQCPVEWLVRAEADTTVTVIAQAQRAGTQRHEVTLL